MFYYWYVGLTIIWCIIYVIRYFVVIKPETQQNNVTSVAAPNAPSVRLQTSTMASYISIALILIPGYCMLLGYGNGSKMTAFSEIMPSKNVIVKRYGDNIICKNYVPQTKSFGDSLIVFKIGGNNQIHAVYVDIKKPL